jgi:hypothetical protein
MEELKADYLVQLPEKWNVIHTAAVASDRISLRTEYHKIKGAGKTYGYPEVSLLGEVMEKICDLNPEDLDLWVKRSLELLEKTIETRKKETEFLIESETDYQLMIQFVNILELKK